MIEYECATLEASDARDAKRKVKVIWWVWGLAAAGVVCAALQQIMVYQSDKKHEQEQITSENKHDEQQTALRGKLDDSLQKQEYARGQLDAVVGILGNSKQGDSTLRAAILTFLKTIGTPPSATKPPPQDALRKKVTDLIADLRASDFHARFSAVPSEKNVERRAIGGQFGEVFGGRCYNIASEMETRNMKSEGMQLRNTCGGAIRDFGQDQIENVIGQLRQFASELP